MTDSMQEEAEQLAADKLATLAGLSYSAAAALPAAAFEDLVVAGKELQMTVFRQQGIPGVPEAILVTVQLVRAGLGGVLNFKLERGLVYLSDGAVRAATESELESTA